MKTKEFIEQVEKMGFQVCEEKKYIEVMLKGSLMRIAIVSKDEIYSLRTTYQSYENLDDGIKSKLFELITKYARTPLQDREIPKRYYLKLKIRNFLYSNDYTINQCKKDGSFILSNELESLVYKTKFTQSEIDAMPKELQEAFDKIHVQDED